MTYNPNLFSSLFIYSTSEKNPIKDGGVEDYVSRALGPP